MRTTLKRGIGRSAAGNGNGNGRVVLPPPALSPMTVYRMPAPARRSGWRSFGRVVLWALTAATSVALALAGAAYLYFEYEVVHDLRATTKDVKVAAQRLDVPLPGAPATALVVGYDFRKFGTDAGAEPRSDTIMLLRADPQLKAISMLSFPRDLVVDVVCPGQPTFRDRINTAYTECGTQGTLETVRKLTGVQINYLITVNFRGFRQIVDRLGGVWIDVDRRYFNDNSTNAPGLTYAEINLFPGYQKLDGARALQYVRYRHTDSDIYRIVRQQQFVRGFKDQIASEFSAFDLPKILGAVTSNVEVGVGGGGQLKGETLLSYALFAYGLPSGHFFQTKLEGLEGYAELSLPESNLQAALTEFTSPDVEAADKAGEVSLGRKVKKKPVGPPPSQVPIVVLNGNGVDGSASNAAYLLQQRKYPILAPPNGADANAPSFNYFHTKVYYDPVQESGQAAARKVANLFGAADVEEVPPEVLPKCDGAVLCVVVGQTFHGTLAPSAVDRTPEKEAPTVRTDPDETRAVLAPIRGQLPFQVALPTVLEANSNLDSELGRRIYKVGGDNKTLRLTYRTGGGEYWGIQQMAWDAPILDGKSFRHRIGGRTYDFYFNGPRLHMVVLRHGGATYWVVNTLLDTLSNETMIEIAKGLHFLPRR